MSTELNTLNTVGESEVTDTELRPAKRVKKMDEEDEKLEALWVAVKIKDLIEKQKIHTIDAKANVVAACETLAKYSISSAPVWSEEDGVICGMFDFRDLGAQLIKAFDQELAEGEKKSLSTLKAVLGKHSAELASDLSQHDKFYSVNEDDVLLDAVTLFGQGLHRLVILNNERKLAGIISQSDALKYFYKQLNKKENLWIAEKTLGDLKLVHDHVISLDEHATVLQGLKLMHSKGLSSIALVNKKGHITSNFSMSDIKYLLHLDQLNLLHYTCAQFIREVRIQKDKENDYKTTLPVFVVTKDSTIQHTIGKLQATRTHRVWVVQSPTDHTVIGVVSLSDILKALTPKDSRHRWEHQPLISFVPSS